MTRASTEGAVRAAPGTHIEMRPSDEQRANLRQLARYLEDLPKGYARFNMQRFCAHRNGMPNMALIGVSPLYARVVLADDQCGTCACAVGHGPAAGIAPDSETDWCWDAYMLRCFGACAWGTYFANTAKTWQIAAGSFLFSGDWYHTMPTAHEAAFRIRYALKHGIPAAAASIRDWPHRHGAEWAREVRECQ